MPYVPGTKVVPIHEIQEGELVADPHGEPNFLFHAETQQRFAVDPGTYSHVTGAKFAPYAEASPRLPNTAQSVAAQVAPQANPLMTGVTPVEMTIALPEGELPVDDKDGQLLLPDEEDAPHKPLRGKK